MDLVFNSRPPDPLDERDQLVASADECADEKTKELVRAWKFAEPTNVKRALELAYEGEAYLELRSLVEHCPKGSSRGEYLGKLLRGAKGQPVQGKKFAKTVNKMPKWHLVDA